MLESVLLSSGSRCTLVSYSPKLSYDPAHMNGIIQRARLC
ncbi:hypothetical protein LEP1GSC036_4434 [Leptospira weilii str. 2006001853]|uniref:Uncharacterized protein n=1 Tax=Leptospira weilii str. 2006001853 TaxID=1001589 RepID=A0A828Z538_9LEPT|nr:hypothetical protein LEP1GSC036_4434 [Leptospira weilii str. 2006001853]EMJ63164.1 hypothetical protein LEP1GSC051_1165 [Leptospira sp. P2653]